MFCSIFSKIEIDAPAEKVWNAFIDFARYPQWNPLITQIRGKPERGQRLQLTLSIYSNKKLNFNTRIRDIIRNAELHCSSSLGFPFLFDCDYVCQLEIVTKSRTLLKQWFKVSGLFVPLFIIIYKKKLSEGFSRHNIALKNLVVGR